jgi:hypothetical protein
MALILSEGILEEIHRLSQAFVSPRCYFSFQVRVYSN